MDLKVDPDSPLPIYYQIREQLRQQILSGHLNPAPPSRRKRRYAPNAASPE